MSRLADLQRAVELATKGPWEVHFGYDVTGYPCFFIHGMSGEQKRDKIILEVNATFIALSRSEVPKLLAFVKAWDILQETMKSPNSGHEELCAADERVEAARKALDLC